MRTSVSIAAAALFLLSFTPALAGSLSEDQADQIAASAPSGDQTQVAQPSEKVSDDDVQLVIMGKSVHVQVPNPNKNPGPRLLTDAWAMRT